MFHLILPMLFLIVAAPTTAEVAISDTGFQTSNSDTGSGIPQRSLGRARRAGTLLES